MWKLLILTLLCFKSLDISSAQQDESEGSSEQPMMRSQSAKDDEESPESRPNKIEHPSENAKESDMAKKQHNSEKDDIIPPSDQKSPAVRSRNGNIEKNTTTAKNTSKKTTPEDSNAISKKNAPTGSLDAASAKNLTTGGLGAFMMKNAVTAGLDAASAKNLTTGPSGAPLMKNAATGGAPLMKNAATGGAPLMKNAATQSSPSTTRSPTTPTRTSSSTTRSPSLTTRSPSLTTRSPSSTTQSPGATSSQNKPTGSPETPSTPTEFKISIPNGGEPCTKSKSIVSLRYDFAHFCTGVILSSTAILTNAHCLFKGIENPLEPTSIRVFAGNVDIDNDHDGSSHNVRSYVVPPEFEFDDPYTYVHNIAILYLADEITMKASVEQAKIGTFPLDDMIEVKTMGWATDQLSDRGFERIATIDYLLTIGSEPCKNVFGANLISKEYSFCAIINEGLGKCKGGPAFRTDNDELVGILSFTKGCLGEHPNVYVKVGSLEKWITDHLKPPSL